MNETTGFTSFLCPHCHTELEASLDMRGASMECPSCGRKLTVPGDGEGQLHRHAPGDDAAVEQMRKSTTLRIEIGDL